MYKNFSLQRDQVHFDFDMSRVNKFLEEKPGSVITHIASQGSFNLLIVVKVETPKADTL